MVIKGFAPPPLSQSDIAIKMYPVNPVFAPCAAIEESRGSRGGGSFVSVFIVYVGLGARNVLSYTRRRIQNV